MEARETFHFALESVRTPAVILDTKMCISCEGRAPRHILSVARVTNPEGGYAVHRASESLSTLIISLFRLTILIAASYHKQNAISSTNADFDLEIPV